ncbi:MAG: FAD:protein FMN transferase [Deltaproteobacteria bacterium]|nr:FAD:protein FMN transferase [Deltaproteobacteria bacterium]
MILFKKSMSSAILLSFAMLLLGADWAQESFVSMGTKVDVILPAEHQEQVAGVRNEFLRIEEMMSEWKAGSPLTSVNNHAGEKPVPVPHELYVLIEKGIQIGHQTNGAFDISWAALWGLWDFKAVNSSPPDKVILQERLRLVGFKSIKLNPHKETVYLPRKGMKIGLGGIAKGYALQRAAHILRQKGIQNYLLSAGGQVLSGGTKSGRAWRVGIRSPRGKPTEYFAVVDVMDVSVSTSGDYERFFLYKGVRYHHILDMSTGAPAAGTRSVTVIAEDAVLADALSTALFVLGAKESLRLVANMEKVDALIVDAKGEMHFSKGLKSRMRFQGNRVPSKERHSESK